jgi:hypothetical protein
MKKSELKKIVLEALTPDEAAKVEPKYKETYAAMIKGKGPLKLKKYDNPDKVVRGRVVNTIKNESLKIAEKLGKKAKVGDYIEDFTDSNAPQFKGKSDKKKKQMAVAAFLNKEEQKLDEEISDSTFQKHADRVEDLLRQLIGATKSVDSSQDDTEEDVEALDKSIDYLSAALTDKDPLDIELDQSTFGRLAKPTNEDQKLDEIDAIMEKSAYDAGRLEKKVKSILKKEGGAVGLKPLVDAAKELGASKKDLMDILKKMKDVKTHKDGDIIDASGLNEGHGLETDDLEQLKTYTKNLPEDTLSDKAIKRILNFLIKSNIKVDKTKDLSKGKKVDEASGMDIAKKNMDDYKRLNELVKAALMGPISEKKQRPDYPDIDGDGDTKEPMVKAAKDKEKAEANESFDSLVKKVDKAKGYTKKEAEKVAGAIAAKKMKGAGKGPTAKQKKRMAETILKELRGGINEMAGEDLELKSLAKKMIPTLKKLGFEVEYSTDTSMKTLKNAGDKFVALRVQDGMLGVHIPFKAGLDAAKEIQKEIQKSLGNEFEYKLTKSKRGPGLEFYTILIRNK